MEGELGEVCRNADVYRKGRMWEVIKVCAPPPQVGMRSGKFKIETGVFGEKIWKNICGNGGDGKSGRTPISKGREKCESRWVRRSL